MTIGTPADKMTGILKSANAENVGNTRPGPFALRCAMPALIQSDQAKRKTLSKKSQPMPRKKKTYQTPPEVQAYRDRANIDPARLADAYAVMARKFERQNKLKNTASPCPQWVEVVIQSPINYLGGIVL